MVKNKYQKGVRFEYQIRDKLKKEGWIVFRTAGSHSMFDLIAVKGKKIRFIQCKVNSNISKSDLKDIQAFLLLDAPLYSYAEIYIKNGREIKNITV